jgi:aquaporin Z
MSITPILGLESPWSREFDDARVEWRRLFSEFFGTFLLVLVGAGGAVVDAASGGQIGRVPGYVVAGCRAAARGELPARRTDPGDSAQTRVP